MPRNTSKRKTQRVRVAQGQQADPRFVTAAKIDGRAAGRAGAEAAFGLADMLNNLMPLAEKAEIDTARKAEADFQTGNVDPNNTSRIYRNNVNRLSARANWIKDEADINESLKGLDLDNISQPELDAHIDEQFRKKYDGLDDPTIAQELLPKLQTYREEKYAEVLARQQALENAKIGSDLTVITQDAYQAAIEEGQPFDYYGMHDQVRSVKQGAESNELYFQIIKDIAIRHGDPDLIRNIPEKWEDGTPTFTSIPDYNEKVLAAEKAAMAQKLKIQKEEAAKQESLLNDVALEAVRAATEGDLSKGQQLLDLYTNMDGAQAKDVITFEKALNTLNDNFGKQEANIPELINLSAKVYSRQSSINEILQHAALGTFGRGKQASDEAQQLMVAQKTIDTAGGSETASPTWKAYRDAVKNRYYRDPNDITVDPTARETYAKAMLDYNKFTIEDGMSDDKAYYEVIKKWDERNARQLEASVRSKAFTSEEAITALERGTISPFQAAQVTTAAQAKDALKAGTLRPQRARDLFTAIINRGSNTTAIQPTPTQAR